MQTSNVEFVVKCSLQIPHHPLNMQVLAELMGDKSLERFRIEYEKLHRALKKSH